MGVARNAGAWDGLRDRFQTIEPRLRTSELDSGIEEMVSSARTLRGLHEGDSGVVW